MIDIAAVFGAADVLSNNWAAWAVIVPGLLIGLIGGAIPGISVSMAMAIFLPMTLYMDFLSSILFLTSIFTGASFGGSIPAVLMNIPGTSSAVATTFDGYPMAQSGRHNEALGVALLASCVGAIMGYVLLFMLIEPLSHVVLKLGPVEMLLVALWGLALIATFHGGHMSRGLMSGVIGVLIGTIGMNDAGFVRGTMNIPTLLDGVPTIPAMMGLFVASQLFGLGDREYLVKDEAARKMSFALIWKGVRMALRYPKVLCHGTLLGIGIGAIPGVGASVANLISYAQARRGDKDQTSFGKGNPKGVVAAESANSSSEGGSMATLLALGIPGGGGTAILLAAFAMHNVLGGPKFLADNKDVVYAIIFGNFVQSVLLLIVGLGFIHVASGIVKVPLRILVPSVMSLAIFGSFAIAGNMAGPVTLFVFSILGWLMTRYGYSVPAMVVGLLLGRMVEAEALRTYQLSAGDLGYFLERPIALGMIVLLALSLALPALTRRRGAVAAAHGTTGGN